MYVHSSTSPTIAENDEPVCRLLEHHRAQDNGHRPWEAGSRQQYVNPAQISAIARCVTQVNPPMSVRAMLSAVPIDPQLSLSIRLQVRAGWQGGYIYASSGDDSQARCRLCVLYLFWYSS